MTTQTLTVTEFLLARIAEDEERARLGPNLLRTLASGSPDPSLRQAAQREDARIYARVLAECAAKRRIIELHQSWPVLVQTPPEIATDSMDVAGVTFSMSQRIAYLTEQEYRTRFGDEPPTAPMMSALASVYADHPDFREEWRA